MAIRPEPPGAFLADAQREELRRRVADADANPDAHVSWDEVYAQTLERLLRSKPRDEQRRTR